MEAYLEHWLSRSPSKRKQLLDKSWTIAKRSLHYLEASKQYHDYAETYNQLVFSVAMGQEYDWNPRTRARKLQDAIECGRKTIGILRSVGRKEELTRTLVRTSLFLDTLSDNSSDSDKLEDYRLEGLAMWEEAVRLSKDVAYAETSRPPQGFHRILDHNQNLVVHTDALKIVKPQRDNFATGWLMDALAKWTFYSAEGIENQTQSVQRHVDALHFAEGAAQHYETIGFTSPIIGVLWAHSPHTEHFLQVSTHTTDLERRGLLLEKSLRSTPELLRLAKRTEHPQVEFYSYHVSSRSAANLAKLETNKRRKKELLREALRFRLKAVRIVEQIDPIVSWNLGINRNNLADIQVNLAELEKDPQKRRELLLQANLNHEKGLKSATSFVKSLTRPESHILRVQLGLFYSKHGEVLAKLGSAAGDDQYLVRAAKEYLAAGECYKSIPRYGKAAESYWKAAEIYDCLQSHSLASENFVVASRTYTALGRQAPHLKEFSENYARYLLAWSEIELARSAHMRLQYGLAAKSYSSAARLHKRTKRWGFLAPYYSAWSKLESAEELSKKGKHHEAMRAFQDAEAFFVVSRTSLRERLSLLDQPAERTMVGKLANGHGEAFCHARTILEEAVIAENVEDYRASSEKFGLASEKLREISESAGSELNGREAGFLSILCEAWQVSDRAELEGSINQLDEAQALFRRARELSPSENAGKLASGHEAFSKALIASRKFADTLNLVFYEEASRQLDLAADHYLDSGFRNASAQAVARKLLLDAYAKLNIASKEEDQQKKGELYRLTSALLEESAKAFLRAQQPKKRDKALRLLEKATMESKLASRLTEILNTASGAPANIAFQTPVRGYEKAVGVERFERSDIEARFTAVTRGSDSNGNLEIEIEILNIGERPVRLARLDETVPEGAELLGKSGKRIRSRSMTLDQGRIAPSKTATIKLVVSPGREGMLRIGPKVIFFDDTGQQRERFMEPIVVPTSRIIEFLASSFVGDSTGRRLAPAYCGWRTLMEVVNELKIPRSHVYGEPRYGRIFGKQLESLVKSKFVEYRIFPGERGRGGDITKVRVLSENEDVKKYLEGLDGTPGKLDSIGWTASPLKKQPAIENVRVTTPYGKAAARLREQTH